MASDRPFHRQLIKLATRLLLGANRAHYHSWLPSLAIHGRTASVGRQAYYRSSASVDLLGSEILKARAGRRIVIIGSGPSVTGADFASLLPRSALLLNGAISLIGNGIETPFAVAIEDERFIWRHFELMQARLVDKAIPLLLSPGVRRASFERDVRLLEGRAIILIDDIRKPYGAPRRNDAALQTLDHVKLRGAAGISAAPDLGVFQGGSVVISALQFALATDAHEIGFIGVDISNANSARFYEKPGDIAFSGIAGAEERILTHIALARDEAAKRGVHLVNHSTVSALASIGLGYRPLDESVV